MIYTPNRGRGICLNSMARWLLNLLGAQFDGLLGYHWWRSSPFLNITPVCEASKTSFSIGDTMLMNEHTCSNTRQSSVQTLNKSNELFQISAD